MEIKVYYIVDLELSLKNCEYVFGFVNISHIPYYKFEEIFKDQFTNERCLFEDSVGYGINQDIYLKHKVFLDKEIPMKFDFSLFDYSVRLWSVESEEYKPNYYTEPPPKFE